MDFYTSKVDKLTKSSDYQRVYKHSRFRFVGKGFIVLKLICIPLTTVNRYGVVASKKVGGAVVRNLWKRRLRVICRKALSCIKAGADYVIILNQKIVDQQFSTVQNNIHQIVQSEHSKQ